MTLFIIILGASLYMKNANPLEIKSVIIKNIEEMEANSSLFVVHPNVDFTRNRILTFSETMRAILGMRGNTLDKELDDYFDTTGQYATSSAFIQQRNKILPDAFDYLFHEVNYSCEKYDVKTFEGYHLYAVDGSDLNVYYDEDAESFFSNGKNKGFNQLHINCLYDVLNDTYKDCIIQPSPKTNEPYAAWKMVEHSHMPEKSILMGDRGYDSMNLIEHCKRAGTVVCIRVKEDWIKEVANLPMLDCDVDILFELRQTQKKQDKIDYQLGKAKYISGISKYGKYKKSQSWDFELPFKFSIRIVRFKKPDGEYETIATTLNRFQFPANKLCELYHIRWNEETAFRQLKYNLSLVNLHSRKEDLIKQEIFARLVMFNFVSRISAFVTVKPRKQNNKYIYCINFTMAVQHCIKFFRYRGNEPPDVCKKIRRHIRPDRPGRTDMRKMKTKTAVWFMYRVA